jgi:CheY-like chemotaxis protein
VTQAGPGAAPRAVDTARPRRVSVLVVDDDPAARYAIVQILRRLGFEVAEAGSVAAAVGKLDEQPDWVVLDLMLPDGSGFDVLSKVAERRGRSRVCVVSGAGPALLDAARSLGPQHVLTKPLDVPRLIAILNT